MRLKSVIKYYLSDMKIGVITFYVAMVAIFGLLGGIISISISNRDNSFIGGGEMAAAIFLFVVGLNSFKHNFLFLSINGIPRKLLFKGFVLAALIICTIMAAIDVTYANIFAQFLNYKSAFYQLYWGWTENTSWPLVFIIDLLWTIATYLFAIMTGYFITGLYYKMTKLPKIIVSIGVPGLLFVVLPIIEETVTKGKIFRWIEMVTLKLNGLSNGMNPSVAVLSYVVGAAFAAGLSFILVRRAVVKE